MKKLLKVTLATLAMVALIICSVATLSSSIHTMNYGIEFNSSSQIDDKYGKLDSNTRHVIEKTFEKVTRETGFNFYFSYVFEELNDTYVLSLSANPKTIFVFYDASENAIDIVTNIEMKEDSFRKTLKEDEDLEDFIPNYMNSVKNSITEQSNKVYIENMSGKFLTTLLIFLVLLAIFAAFFIPYVRLVKKNIKEIQDAKIAKKQQKLARKAQKTQTDAKQVKHSGDIDH